MQQTFKNNTPKSPLGDLGVRDSGDIGVNKKHNTPVPQRGD